MCVSWFVQGFFCTLDLKDAYSSIPIHQSHRKYLVFTWCAMKYRFNILCFGLASAPRIFIKGTKSFLSNFRVQGLRVSAYFDEFIIIMN